jgi:hypothetical protein
MCFRPDGNCIPKGICELSCTEAIREVCPALTCGWILCIRQCYSVTMERGKLMATSKARAKPRMQVAMFTWDPSAGTCYMGGGNTLGRMAGHSGGTSLPTRQLGMGCAFIISHADDRTITPGRASAFEHKGSDFLFVLAFNVIFWRRKGFVQTQGHAQTAVDRARLCRHLSGISSITFYSP